MRKKYLKKAMLLTVVGVLAYKKSKENKRNKGRRWWIRPSNQLRSKFGFYETTFQRIKNMKCEMFAKAVRMSSQTFDTLLSQVCLRLEKTSLRKPVSPECRLFMTLMYLAHGGSRKLYARSFKVGWSTFSNIIYGTCQVLWEELNEIYLSPPNKQEWTDIAKEFEQNWRLPNCIGAIDGKQINMICPPNTGSSNYNLKGKRNIVLLAACDARYSFTMIDIGTYGNQRDEGIFADSTLSKLLANNQLDIPHSGTLPNSDQQFPYFFVGDNAFPLKRYLMRPFPKSTQPDEDSFNKRILHARLAIENTFGILSARWRILRNDLRALFPNVVAIVRATVLLHNILMFMKCSSYCPYNYADRIVDNEVIPGEWRNDTSFKGLPHSRSHKPTREACQLRKDLCQYLMNFK